MLFCKTVVCPEDFSILAKSSCNFKLEIKESILIKLLKPTLNKNISSVPLYLFWYRFCNYTLWNSRSNLINVWFIWLIRSIEMLCKHISLSCVKVYWKVHISQVVLENRCVRNLKRWNEYFNLWKWNVFITRRVSL